MGPQAHGPQRDSLTIAHFVLLHGFCGQPEQWRILQDELEGRGHTTLALRLPRGTWADEIAAVRETVDASSHAGGTGVHVVGHSLGGLLVRAFAEAHPDAAAGLATIAAPPPGFDADWVRTVGHYDADGWFRCNVPAFLELAFPGAPKEFSSLTWVQPPLEGRLPLPGGRGGERRVAICCRDDRAVSYAAQLRGAEQFGAPVVDLPTGHSPHVSHAALVASLLINWLAPESA